MKKSLRALIVLVLSFVMAFSSAISVSAAEPDELVLSIYRTADNIVTLNWEGGGEEAVAYNVYEQPVNGNKTKLNSTPLTGTTYTAADLTENRVHTLSVKAVNNSGDEFCESNLKKIGITQKMDIANGLKSLNDAKDNLKLPVSDLASNMEYLGPTIQDDEYHYWCYSSVTDDNGKIHLFMSRVPKATKFIPGWKTTSEIVHFVGDSSEGPFTEVGVPFSPSNLPDGQMSAHNPRIKKIDDKYVLLYIVRYNYQGAGREGSQATCMATIDELPTEPGSDTIDKWTLVPDTDDSSKLNGVITRYGVKAVNPDMFKVKNENGEDEYVLYFKGNKNPNIESAPYFLYYSTSSKLEGPYTFQGEATDSKTTIEDPSVFEWKGKYFMLTYDLGSGISGAGSVGMLIPSRTPYGFSFKDAWITAGFLPDYVNMPEGTTHAYSGQTRLERPYIVFEDDEPAYFIGTNSADVNGNKVTQSYTFKFNQLPKHEVVIDDSINGGKIEVKDNVAEAEIFDDIILNIVPDEGYVLVPGTLKISSVDAMGRPYSPQIETLDEDQYRFMMPSGDVTITAEFKKPGIVEKVEITPKSAEAMRGETQVFMASVIGNEDCSKEVTWSVEGGNGVTAISESGVLSVDAEEPAQTLTVKAVSVENPTKSAAAEIFVVEAPSNLALGLDESAYTASTHHQNAPGTVKCFPKNAFDGVKTYTGVNKIWTPKAGDTDPWIQVNFGQPTEFNSVKLYDYGQANGGRFSSVAIQVSDDGIKWDNVRAKDFVFNGDENVKECGFDTVTKQYMRVANQKTIDSSKFVHLLEVEVYNMPTVPEVEIQPQNQRAEIGEWATFSIKAAGTPEPAYQWQVSKDQGRSWEIIEAAVSSEYTTEALTIQENGGWYRCIATNKKGSSISEAAELEVFCDHVFDDDFTVDKAPSCTEEGSKSIHCNKCEEIKEQQTMPALGHDFAEYIFNNDASCEGDGTKTAQCSRCDVTDTCKAEGTATGHSFGEWIVVNEPTADAEGNQERICKNCGQKESEIIPAKGNPEPPKVDDGEDDNKNNGNKDDGNKNQGDKNSGKTNNSQSVKTGDSSNIGVWGGILVLSIVLFVAVIVRRRRRK